MNRKYKVLAVGFGIPFPLVVCSLSIDWIALSVTDVPGAGVVIVAVPVRLPCVIAYLGTAYSSQLIDERARQHEVEARTSWPGIAFCAACFQAAPQKIVKTSTAVMSGPLRYVMVRCRRRRSGADRMERNLSGFDQTLSALRFAAWTCLGAVGFAFDFDIPFMARRCTICSCQRPPTRERACNVPNH